MFIKTTSFLRKKLQCNIRILLKIGLEKLRLFGPAKVRQRVNGSHVSASKGSAASREILISRRFSISVYFLWKCLGFGWSDSGDVKAAFNNRERDEFAYQEMIAHIPLNAHQNPKKVLVIGGGDGGVLREVVKHDCVESVTLVEIDEVVVKVAKKFLPAMAAGFSHPKVNVVIGDGFEYLKNNVGSYDVIITDSSDPVGPAEALFSESFYDLMKNALLPGGIICTQGIFFSLN